MARSGRTSVVRRLRGDAPVSPDPSLAVEHDATPELVLRAAGISLLPSVAASEAIEAGLPARKVQAWLSSVGFELRDAMRVLGPSERTLKRKLKDDEPLDVTTSDRAYRLMEVTARAARAFGDLEQARRWLLEANPAFGDRRPIEVIVTEPGLGRVLSALNHVEYGGVL